MKIPQYFLKIVLITIAFLLIFSDNRAQNNFNGIYKVSNSGKAFTLKSDTIVLHVDSIALLSINEFMTVKKKHDRKMNSYELLITLTESGTKIFAEVSEANIGKQLAVIIDNKLLTAPFVNTIISEGKISVTGLEKETVNEIVKYFKN